MSWVFLTLCLHGKRCWNSNQFSSPMTMSLVVSLFSPLPGSSTGTLSRKLGLIQFRNANNACEEIFSVNNFFWREIYLLPRAVTLNSQTREFQYKLFKIELSTQTTLFMKWALSIHPCVLFVLSQKNFSSICFLIVNFLNAFGSQ